MIVEFQRKSLSTLIEEVKEKGPKAMGVIALIYDNDGHGHFRISGFEGPHSIFIIAGLLDWIKADLVSDLVT